MRLYDRVTSRVLDVSIHAPVWGATILFHEMTLWLVFQSTHPCGVRLYYFLCSLACDCFNPRTRVGCDTFLSLSDFGLVVSIHAPVWGATRLIDLDKNVLTVSIHAPVWGATQRRHNFYYERLFQSTHPCGVRPLQCSLSHNLYGFNPRTRVGCDLL